MRAMLILKMGCQAWVDDYGIDAAGFVFKRVKKNETQNAAAAAKGFCVQQLNLCGKSKEERREEERKREQERQKKRRELQRLEEKAEQKEKENDPLASLPDENRFGFQRLLEEAKQDPLGMLDHSAQQRIQEGRTELHCSVCAALLEHIRQEVLKRPKSLRREYDILPLVEAGCEGGPDLSVPAYFGVEPNPLPPEWTDRYRPKRLKDGGMLTLDTIRKKAAKKRQRWRDLSRTGQQQPPPPEESEDDLMMMLSCKDIVDPARMAEAIFEDLNDCERQQGDEQGCNSALRVAQKTCRAAGKACSLETMSFVVLPARAPPSREL